MYSCSPQTPTHVTIPPIKPFIPKAILLCCLFVLVFAFLIPINPSNQLTAVASTPSITFKQSSLSVTEGDRLKVVIVAPSNLTTTTRVKVTTKAGTAKAGSDFTPLTSTVTFYKGGLKEKTVTLVTKSDSVQEQAETLSLSLSVNNKVVNTVSVTLNDKGTASTPGTGPTLPATANQGNTLGGNPSFTTYSPQGLPQPMNPNCKQVPSKYKFYVNQNRYTPHNPSNPFYIWGELQGGPFPTTLVSRQTLSTPNLKYMTFQFHVPVSGSVRTTTSARADYPAGSISEGMVFISECPWQDYYDEVLGSGIYGSRPDGELSTNAKIIQEWTDVTKQTPNWYSDLVFAESDINKRYLDVKKRLDDMSLASGTCFSPLTIPEGNFYPSIIWELAAHLASPNPTMWGAGASCYVKPGGTYYITAVYPRAEIDVEYPTLIGAPNTNKIYWGAYGTWEAPAPVPKKICRYGSTAASRTDCWFGTYGLGIENVNQEEADRINRFNWKKAEPRYNTVSSGVCGAVVREGAECNISTFDPACNIGTQVLVCEHSLTPRETSGFGPN